MMVGRKQIELRLRALGRSLEPGRTIEIVLIGAAAGILGHHLRTDRVTVDCDVIYYAPPDAADQVEGTAKDLAQRNGWPDDWLNSRAMELDLLPAGWKSRRLFMGSYGALTVYILGRVDLLATKFYASRPQDREDIRDMRPSRDEIYFVRRYLEQMAVPSRKAHLDDLQRAMAFLAVVEKEIGS